MKGINHITFNSMAMVEIVQHYLDDVFMHGAAPEVKSVIQQSTGHFRVEVAERPVKPTSSSQR